MAPLLLSFSSRIFGLIQGRPPQPAVPSPTIQPGGGEPSAGGMVSWIDASLVVEYLLNPFVLAIFVLFIFSVVTLRRYLRQLPLQRRALGLVNRNCGAVSQTAETDPHAIEAELLKEVATNSIAAQRVRELREISANNGEFNQLAFAEVTAAREGAKTSIAKYCASVLVLLGLCGAIFGLSQMVFRMGPELRKIEQLARQNSETPGDSRQARDLSETMQDSVSTLINTMASSLEHTRGAFFASLTGVLMSVILLFLNWLTGRRQVDLLTGLEHLTATKLIPLFRPPRESTELAEVASSFRHGSQYLAGLSGALDTKVTQMGSGLDNLFAVVRKFAEGSEALRVNQQKVFDAQQHMLNVVEQFKEIAARIAAHQGKAEQAVVNVTDAVRKSDENLKSAMTDWQSKHEKLLQSIEQVSKQAHAEAKEARRAIGDSVAETNKLVQGAIDLQLSSIKSQMLESQSVLATTLHESFLSSNGHRDLVNGLSEILGQEKQAFTENLGQALGDVHQKLAEHMDATLKQQAELVAALKELKPSPSNTLRAKAATPVFDAAATVSSEAWMAQQDALVRQVGQVGWETQRLNNLLLMLAGLAIFFMIMLGSLGLVTGFRLWPAEPMSQVIVLALMFVLSLGAGGGAAWLIKTRL